MCVVKHNTTTHNTTRKSIGGVGRCLEPVRQWEISFHVTHRYRTDYTTYDRRKIQKWTKMKTMERSTLYQLPYQRIDDKSSQRCIYNFLFMEYIYIIWLLLFLFVEVGWVLKYGRGITRCSFDCSFVPTPFRLDQWRSCGTASPWTMVVVQRDHL